MSNNETKSLKSTKARLSTIRTRTWTLTVAIVISLCFYLLVNVTMRQAINWIDFVLLCALQIIVHSLYFPDGDIFGQKDKSFIANKEAYNDKAFEISQNRQLSKLREFCKYEYEERKKRYVLNQCSKIEITLEELELLKQKTEKEIKKIETFEIKEIVDGEEKVRLIQFSKYKRKVLYNLLFKASPVEQNHAETIMSAVENDGNQAIKDHSIKFKIQSYIRKVFLAIVVGGIFAYIGYKVKDGFGIAEIVSICMYLTTLFTTAVMAFSSGETCSRVHKSHFYVELSNFIDDFNEWFEKNNK